jgi:acyl-CoA synthetase (AMP-forming)/AMP-acid ligase II
MDPPAESFNGVYHFWDLIAESSAAEPNFEYVADNSSEHIALLRFTGATTGKPKCVKYSLSNILSASCNVSNYSEVLPFQKPKVLVSTPITHASGTIVLPVHFAGGTLLTMNRADVESMCETIEREKVEVFYTVPTVLYRILDNKLSKKYDLSSLKTIRYGASPISPLRLKDLIATFGKIFVQGYTGSETWVPGTILGRNDHDPNSEAGIKRLSSVGRPVPGVEVRIADSKGDEPSSGVIGEIWLRGPNTIQGYYNDPELTKSNFTETGFWKSGDMGFLDDQGFLYLVDRKKDMIISGGFNIYPIEIENCLNSHPAVMESAVVGIPHDDWGEAAHAEVVLKEGAKTSQEELINFCKQHLARYKAPKTIAFVDKLPVNSIGKLLRREVRKKYWREQMRQIH